MTKLKLAIVLVLMSLAALAFIKLAMGLETEDFPPLDDQSIIGYCCHAWAIRDVEGNAEFCFQHENVVRCNQDPNDAAFPYDPMDPDHLSSMCEDNFALIPHAENNPSQPIWSPFTDLDCQVSCPDPLPIDPNDVTGPCTLSYLSIDPSVYPVTLYKVCPEIAQGSGILPCWAWWVPGTFECYDPDQCVEIP